MTKLKKCSMGLGFALVCALASCSGSQGTANSVTKNDAPTKYPQSVADEFLRTCGAAGSNGEFCKCVFEKVQEKYTFEEFSVIESKLAAGRPQDEFVEFIGKARAQCTK